jgi:hypothetical protein
MDRGTLYRRAHLQWLRKSFRQTSSVSPGSVAACRVSGGTISPVTSSTEETHGDALADR